MQIRVNWAFQKDQREDTSGHCHIFVGDLTNDMSHQALFDAFKHCPDCSDARVMWDQATGRLVIIRSAMCCTCSDHDQVYFQDGCSAWTPWSSTLLSTCVSPCDWYCPYHCRCEHSRKVYLAMCVSFHSAVTPSVFEHPQSSRMSLLTLG